MHAYSTFPATFHQETGCNIFGVVESYGCGRKAMHEDQEANVTLRFNAIESSATGVDIMIIDYTTLRPPS